MADDRFPKSKAAASATTPILIDKLPPEVRNAILRQAARQTAESADPAGAQTTLLDVVNGRSATSPATPRTGWPTRTDADLRDMRTIEESGIFGDGGRVVLTNTQGGTRGALAVGRNGAVTAAGQTFRYPFYNTNDDLTQDHLRRTVASTAAGETVIEGRRVYQDSLGAKGNTAKVTVRSPEGTRTATYDNARLPEVGRGLINEVAGSGQIRDKPTWQQMQSRLKAQPAAGQIASALDGALSKTNMKAGTLIDVGQALYPFLTDEIDTDFTIKLIPPQHRKPDETGKVREAIAILDGEPIRLYEGEPWNVPGFESVGVELADYFRSRSPQSRGQDTLGAEIDPVDKSKAGLEVRESEKQAQSKQAFAKTRAMIPGPSVSAERDMVFPTFEEEYQVGKASREPGKK
jgi:hypothetical protein